MQVPAGGPLLSGEVAMEAGIDGGAGGRAEVAMNLDVFTVGSDELDPNPGPVARSRAYTWHGRPEVAAKDDSSAEVAGIDGDFGLENEASVDGMVVGATGTTGPWRKGTTRRNAWGNLSYADLITKAIESSPEKRMTLAQIYGWMVQNISFFKDKGESNSSAGWKNSIRHNLSLHNRFMRVQNEGTGKSSWWMINPDAKAVKIPRRRAATMDTKTYSGKRSRVQRAVSLSTASSSSDLLAKSKECDEQRMDSSVIFSQCNFQSGSTSSGIGLNSLSRMQPVEELEDGVETDLVSSSSSWNHGYTANENFDETLSESLADIFVGNLNKDNMHANELQDQLNAPLASTMYPTTSTQCTFVTRNSPVRYPVTSTQCTAFATHNSLPGKIGALGNDSQTFGLASFSTGGSGAMIYGQPTEMVDKFKSTIRSPAVVDSSIMSCGNIYANQNNEALQKKELDKMIRPDGLSGNLYGQYVSRIEAQPTSLAPAYGTHNCTLLGPRHVPDAGSSSRQLNSQFLLQLLASKPQLMAKMQHLIQARQQQQQQQQQLLNSTVQTLAAQRNPSNFNRSESLLQNLLITSSVTSTTRSDPIDSDVTPSAPAEVRTAVTSTPATTVFIPADLDLNFLDVDAAEIDCDIDQVIKHELTFGENLDFSFDYSTDA